MKKILLTGASGFIGSHLSCFLADEGYEVHLLLRTAKTLPDWVKEKTNITVHTLEISYDEIFAKLSEIDPDVVVHLASLFLAQHEPNKINDLMDSNLKYGTYLLESMAQLGISKFINTGTSWEHFNNAEYEPVNLYSATKHAFQDLLQYYVSNKAIDSITLKLFDTYGPKDKRKKLVHLLKKLVCTGDKLDMSPGEQKINVVHILDVCRAYERSVDLLYSGEVSGHYIFGVASKESISLRQFVSIFEKSTGSKLNINWGGRPYRNREVMTPWTNFETVPDWKEEIVLEDGLLALMKEK